jgi:hypothetical protein
VTNALAYFAASHPRIEFYNIGAKIVFPKQVGVDRRRQEDFHSGSEHRQLGEDAQGGEKQTPGANVIKLFTAVSYELS